MENAINPTPAVTDTQKTILLLTGKIKGNPQGITSHVDLDKLEELVEAQKGLEELSQEELVNLFVEKGVLTPDAPTTPQPKIIKNVVIPPVQFPQRPPVVGGNKPVSIVELKATILANLTTSFTDIAILLMHHYKMDDQVSAKQVKVALRELISEGKVAVDSPNFERLATAHYPDTTTGKTHYWLLKDVTVKAKLIEKA